MAPSKLNSNENLNNKLHLHTTIEHNERKTTQLDDRHFNSYPLLH